MIATEALIAKARLRKARVFAFALSYAEVTPDLVEKIGEDHWINLAKELKTTIPSATTKKMIAAELKNYDSKVRTA